MMKWVGLLVCGFVLSACQIVVPARDIGKLPRKVERPDIRVILVSRTDSGWIPAKDSSMAWGLLFRMDEAEKLFSYVRRLEAERDALRRHPALNPKRDD